MRFEFAVRLANLRSLGAGIATQKTQRKGVLRTLGIMRAAESRADNSQRTFDGIRVSIPVPKVLPEAMARARAAMKKFLEPKPEDE